MDLSSGRRCVGNDNPRFILNGSRSSYKDRDRLQGRVRGPSTYGQNDLARDLGRIKKTSSNGIAELGNQGTYQQFLAELKKLTVGAFANGIELADIVHTTSDGRNVLWLEDDFVVHKLGSTELTESETYKTWQQMEAALKALKDHAADEKSVIEIEFEAQSLIDARASVKARRADLETGDSPRSLPRPETPDEAPEPADEAEDKSITPPRMPTRRSTATAVMQVLTGSGQRAPAEPEPDDVEPAGHTGDEAEEAAGRDSRADTRPSSPGNTLDTQEEKDAANIARALLTNRKKLLDAKLKKIDGQCRVKQEEVKAKSKLGSFADLTGVLKGMYRASDTVGWQLYQKYFDISTVQTILSLLCATDADAERTAPHALFELVLADWTARSRRMDLRHCYPSRLSEKMLQPFVNQAFGIDDALGQLQKLRANAALVQWSPPAKALGTLWGMVPRNIDTAPALDVSGALDVEDITWSDYTIFVSRLRQVPSSSCTQSGGHEPRARSRRASAGRAAAKHLAPAVGHSQLPSGEGQAACPSRSGADAADAAHYASRRML
jgi:hypothetical protein